MAVMFVASIIIILSIISCYSASGLTISDEEYKVLPPIFHIDDHNECLQDKTKVFCKARIKLEPLNKSSSIWKLVQATKEDKDFYNHDELFHAICVNLQNSSDVELARTYSERYKSVGLRAEIIKLDCNDDIVYSLEMYDIIVFIGIGLYVSFIIRATYYDWKTSKNKNTYVLSFSLIDNWRKLTQKDSEARLSHVQGLRFLTLTIIIIMHSYCSYISSYVENTDYFENFPKNVLKLTVLTLFPFLVQIFFLFSGWFLSQNFFKNFHSDGNISKYIVLTFLNRYLRLAPLILVAALMLGGNFIYRFVQGPIQADYADVERASCHKNWWKLLFFFNNRVASRTEMCYMPTWYLSADVQLYAVSLVALAIMWRCKARPLTIFGIFALTGMISTSVVNFIYDADVIVKVVPETSKVNAMDLTEFTLLYAATYQNMPTYMLGLALGYIHFTTQDSNLFKGQIRQMLWWILFLGLPSLAMVLSRCEFESKIVKMVLAGVLKPAFALGIGIGVLGMSHQLGGLLKKMCSWRPFVVLGNCSYSTYLFHCSLVFIRAYSVRKPMYVTDWSMLSSCCYDIITGFTIGVLAHLTVELPASRLQTLCVPRFKKPRLEKNSENQIHRKFS